MPRRTGWRWAFVASLALVSLMASWMVLEWSGTSEGEGPSLEAESGNPRAGGYLDTERVHVRPPGIAQAPTLVQFRLSTEPPGADVVHRGQKVGVTPMTLHIPVEEEAKHAQVEVTFQLKGYQSETVIAGGLGQVFLTQKLQRTRATSPSVRVSPPAPISEPEPDVASTSSKKAESVPKIELPATTPRTPLRPSIGTDAEEAVEPEPVEGSANEQGYLPE